MSPRVNFTVGRLDEPEAEELREYVDSQKCWWCLRSGFKVIAGHIARAHGIDRFALREMAGVFRHAVITDPIYHTARQDAARLAWNGMKTPAPGTKRSYSSAGLVVQRRKLDAARADPAVRVITATNLKIAHLKRRQQHPCDICGKILPFARPKRCLGACQLAFQMKNGTVNGFRRGMRGARQPHPCPVCGSIIARSQPLLCSPECRAKSLHAKRLRPHPCTVCKVRIDTHFRTCSPACRHEAHVRGGKLARARQAARRVLE